MSTPFTFNTDAQFRAFYRLTLAQVVYLESVGLSLSHATARAQAKQLLGLSGNVTHVELINGLRKAAEDCAKAEAPSRPYIEGHGLVSPTAAAAIEEAARIVKDLAKGAL